jgi:hypothetical protein
MTVDRETEGEKMVFEVGKYYKHTGGGYLHILCEAETTMWMDPLIAESAGHGDGRLVPVGKDEAAAVNWTETTKDEWMTNFS